VKDLEPITQNQKGEKHFLQKLIEQGEGTQLDFKFEISDSSKIARTLSAFANTEGGKLLVGVKDNGSIAGVRSEEEFYMVQAAAEMYSKPKIHFQAKSWKINDRIVLEITIPKSKNIHHYALDDEKNWKAWVRVKDQNIMADEVILKIWSLSKQKEGIFLNYNQNEKAILQFLDNNESITLEKYCKIALLSKKEATTIICRLVCLKILDLQISETGIIFRLNHNFDLQNYERRF
jgi:predicted HTH transcriptional regulator